MKNNLRLFLSISLILAFILAPWIEMPQSVSAQTLDTFVIWRDGNTYHAESQLTSSSYSGSLKYVVESAVVEMNATGGTVAFQAGDFDLGAEWFELFDLYNITFAGQGIDVTVIRNNVSAETDTEPFDITHGNGVTIRDMTVSAGGPLRSTSDALDFDGGNNSLVERVKVTSSRSRGIVFDGKDVHSGTPQAADGNIVRDCMIVGIAGDGIELLASSSNRIERCQILDVGGHGIQINKASSIAEQPNKKSTDNLISQNYIENAGNDGINIVSGDRNRLSGNTILNSSDDVASQDGIQITSINSIACDDNIVELNTATDNQAVKTQRYGLSISSMLCNRTVIVDNNNFTGNLVGNIQNNGTGTIYDFSDDEPPTAPTELVTTNASHNRVEIAWNAATDNTGVYGYTVYRDGATLNTVSGANLSFSDTTVLPATTYQYTVDAFDQAGNHSILSNPVTVTTLTMPSSVTFTPEADTYVNAASTLSNYGSATVLRFDASPDVHSYLRFKVEGLAWTTITRARLLIYPNTTNNLGISALAVADNGWGELTTNYTNAPVLGDVLATSDPITTGGWVTLDVTSYVTGEGTYSFGVTTPNLTAQSMASRESAYAPQLILDLQTNEADTQPPSTPTELTAEAVSATQVNLNWGSATDNVNVVGYTVYCNGIMMAIVPGMSLAYTDTTVLPETLYQYAVDAYDQAGNHSTLSSPVTVVTPAIPASLTFTPLADTYVNASYPTTNYGAATALRADADPDAHSYVRFNVQGLGGQQIAKVRLLIYTNSTSSLGINANAVTDNTWGELTMNYYNMPVFGSDLASSGSLVAGSWVTFDVTPYVTGEGEYSFGINTASTTSLSLAARETGATAPQLIVDFQAVAPDTEPPGTPGGLTATAISTSQVELNWLAATDNVGVAGYLIYRDGAQIAAVDEVTAYSDTLVAAATTYQYTVIARDAAGNISAASDSVAVTTLSETNPPSVALIAPLDGATLGGSILLEALATDDTAIDHVDFVVNDVIVSTVNSAPYQVTWNSALTLDGAATIRAHAVDAANNSADSAAVTVMIDNTAPDTAITAAPSDTVATQTATFTFTANDTATFTCSLDGAAFSVCASPAQYTDLADGLHTFEVISTDAFGNADPTPASHSWTIDTTPPDTTITAAPAAFVNSTSASFSFTASEASSTFNCSLDGAAFSACISPRTYTGLASGLHTFQVWGTDALGNTETTPASYSWTVDTVAPRAFITAEPAGYVNSTTANFSFTANEANTTFVCSLDNATYDACVSPVTYTDLTNGSHIFRVRATDAAGNISAIVSQTWTIDTSAPTGVSITAPTNGLTVSGKVAIKASASDNSGIAEVRLYVDGQLVSTTKKSPYSISWNTTRVPKTPHTLYVVAVDYAGNITQSAAITVTVK